jgi:hypothetical protein
LYTGSSYPITASWALYVVNGASGTASLSLTNITRSGNGSGSVFNLNNNTFTGANSLVFLGGITLNNNIDYTLSSGILTFTSPPLLNEEIHAVKFTGGGANGTSGTSGIVGIANAQTFTSNGVASQYALTQSVIRSYDIIVAINGVVQNYSSSYTVTGSTLTLASAPPLNSKIDVRFLGSAAGGGGGGTSGTSGTGAAGTQGTSGSSGSTGAPGSSGSSGTGAAGTQGTSGSSGNSGTSGSSGSSGDSGSSGSSGSSGDSGSSGSSGTSGSSGSSGDSGSSGTSGSSGQTGTSGSSGATGTSGSSGASGASLITGSLYPITSSWSRRAITASYALNASGGGGSSLYTGSTYPITASRAITASYALTSAGGGGGSSLYTGSTYPITSSYATFAINIAGSISVLTGTDINWNNPTYEKNISTGETYTFTNVTTGSSIVVILNNTGSNSILATFPNNTKWANSLPPTNILSSATSIYTFVRTRLYVLGSSTENYQ